MQQQKICIQKIHYIPVQAAPAEAKDAASVKTTLCLSNTSCINEQKSTLSFHYVAKHKRQGEMNNMKKN